MSIRVDSRVLWTIAAVLIILWLLGFSFYPIHGLIHVLLVIAIIVIIVSFLTGRRKL